MAHQVVDAHAPVRLATQAQPATRCGIEPEDFAIPAKQYRAVGHGRRHAPELAQQHRHALLVKALAAVDAARRGHHFAPQPGHVRRRFRVPATQPAIEPQQVAELQPEQDGKRNGDELPRAAEQETEARGGQHRRNDARQVAKGSS